MDPYVVVETRQQRFRTNTKQGAGKTPVWNQVSQKKVLITDYQFFDIDVKYIGDDMTLTVFDEDVGADDKVGGNTIKLSSLCVNGGLDEWFQV